MLVSMYVILGVCNLLATYDGYHSSNHPFGRLYGRPNSREGRIVASVLIGLSWPYWLKYLPIAVWLITVATLKSPYLMVRGIVDLVRPDRDALPKAKVVK